MKITLKKVVYICIAGLLTILSSSAQRQPASDIPVEIIVLFAPTPVESNEAKHFVYELHLTNFYSREVKLNKIEIFPDGNETKPLTTYTETEINDLLFRLGQNPDLKEKRIISGGMRAVVYLWLTLPKDQPIPSSLQHRLYFDFVNAKGKNESAIVDDVSVRVNTTFPLVISPPLRGVRWIAGNGPSNDSIHRRPIIPFYGRTTIIQRFAYDFMKLDEDGNAMHGDPSKNNNWYSYGEEVVAVADGIILDIQDSIPENIPLSPKRAIPISTKTSGGNYVVVDLGKNQYAFYLHLQPKSISVKIGDRVRSGQVLGRLGNSGSSDAPHLHFHIADTGSLAGAEGLPFVFESFELMGMAKLFEAIGLEPKTKKQKYNISLSKRWKEMPLENAVIRFP